MTTPMTTKGLNTARSQPPDPRYNPTQTSLALDRFNLLARARGHAEGPELLFGAF